MKIPLKTCLTFGTLIVLMIFQYQNCSSYGDASPFQTSSPSTGAKSSAPADVRMDSPIGSIDVGQDAWAVVAGGDCNVGLSTQHYIEVSIRDQNNAEIPVRVDNICIAGRGPSLPRECFRATQFRCEHGRYYVHLPVTCDAFRNQPRSFYRLFAQLVTLDEAGSEKREKRGGFDRTFEIAWAPNSCQ